jgi:hypothetical protein
VVKFRVSAFALHLASSAVVLALILGGLYLGWYQWPGWYVTDFVHVTKILVGVDLTLGPLFTLLVANPRKSRRELARDIGVIVAVQLVALFYGAGTLWSGRPLYYAYSAKELEMVAASEVPANEAALARQQNPDLAPHWYSRPRWIWAALPTDPAEQAGIRKREAAQDIDDITGMPSYFRGLAQAGDTLRADLRKVDEQVLFSRQERQTLKARMARMGLPTDTPDALSLIGRQGPVLVVFDRSTLSIQALLRAD